MITEVIVIIWSIQHSEGPVSSYTLAGVARSVNVALRTGAKLWTEARIRLLSPISALKLIKKAAIMICMPAP